MRTRCAKDVWSTEKEYRIVCLELIILLDYTFTFVYHPLNYLSGAQPILTYSIVYLLFKFNFCGCFPFEENCYQKTLTFVVVPLL